MEQMVIEEPHEVEQQIPRLPKTRVVSSEEYLQTDHSDTTESDGVKNK